MPRRKRKTIAAHPGEILRTEFMEPMGVTAYQLAKAVHLPGIYEIVRGQRAISADVALRLGKYSRYDAAVLDEPSNGLRSANCCN
jgi:addiction module HigA family antidote